MLKNQHVGSDGMHLYGAENSIALKEPSIVAIRNGYSQSQAYVAYDDYFSRNSLHMTQTRSSDISRGGLSPYNYGQRNVSPMMLTDPARTTSPPPQMMGQWSSSSNLSMLNRPPTRPSFQPPIMRQENPSGATAFTGQCTLGPLQSLLMGQGDYTTELEDDNALLSQQSFYGGLNRQLTSLAALWRRSVYLYIPFKKYLLSVVLFRFKE
ncbi:hypothetical protein ACHQM5_011909 [Ranunculus cassubicifolius]